MNKVQFDHISSFCFRNACAVSHDILLGRWRLSLELFGRVFCDDVGAEPSSVIGELGGFPVKESKFKREMEKLRNSQQGDLSIKVGLSYFLSLLVLLLSTHSHGPC